MFKFGFKSVLVLMVVSGCLSVPQGRLRVRQQQQQEVVNQQPAHNLDPAAIESGMNSEHAKLIENLQRLKRTLDHVKERVAVGKGTYRESAQVDMKNPEGAILTVLKSLQEQGQLFAMINDMLKAGSVVQNQTEKIQDLSKLQEQARAESVHAETTNQIAPASPSAIPTVAEPLQYTSSVPTVGPTGPSPTAASGQFTSSSTTTQRGTSRRNNSAPSKQHGYDDYQYQYRDETGDGTGDDQYDYHYDAQGYDDTPKRPARTTTTTTTTTTTRRPPPRRLRGRITRSDYY